jgi:methionyl-tRNA formyltransferase
VKKIGLRRVISKVAFALFIRPLLFKRDQGRIDVILRQFGLEDTKPVNALTYAVGSVNDPSCHALIQTLAPDIIIVNGTRILSKKTLSMMNAPVINTHQGFTPCYRGAHGAYWAMVENDLEHCGVTVHLVDEGIDTGNIIARAKISTEAQDSFVTYPYLQTAAALDLLKDAIENITAGSLKSVPITGASSVWYHPGFFQYIGNALRGVH